MGLRHQVGQHIVGPNLIKHRRYLINPFDIVALIDINIVVDNSLRWVIEAHVVPIAGV
jgi:hypothetical protein